MSSSASGRLRYGSDSTLERSARRMIDTPTGRGSERDYRRSITGGIHRWVGRLFVVSMSMFCFVLTIARPSFYVWVDRFLFIINVFYLSAAIALYSFLLSFRCSNNHGDDLSFV